MRYLNSSKKKSTNNKKMPLNLFDEKEIDFSFAKLKNKMIGFNCFEEFLNGD